MTTTKNELTARDRDILEFERQWWQYPAAKETAMRERFDMGAVRYYQLLGALLDRPEAMAADPSTVKRLQRLREQRRAARSHGRSG